MNFDMCIGHVSGFMDLLRPEHPLRADVKSLTNFMFKNIAYLHVVSCSCERRSEYLVL